MKKAFLLIVISSILNTPLLACTPALPLIAQQTNLGKILASEAYAKAINSQLEQNAFVSIVDITFNGGVRINLNNGCSLKGELKYDPPLDAGACPYFREVVIENVCQ